MRALLMAAAQQQRRGGASLEPETTALVSRFDVAPSAALLNLINVTIKGLKDDGIFQLADCMYIRGLHDSQAACQNWIKNAHNSTLHGGLTFTAKKGIQGNGVIGSYINNNYTPSLHKDKMTLSSTTVSVISDILGTVNFTAILGALGSVNRIQYFYYLAENEVMVLNSQIVNLNQVNINAGNHATYTRTNSINAQGFIDGETVGSSTSVVASGAEIEYSVCELGRNHSSGILSPYNGRINYSFYGAYLTPTQVRALYNRIKYFYDNVDSTF